MQNKKFIAQIFTIALVIAIAIPTSLIARPFNNDAEIRVYPDNEVVSFAPTKVGETRTEYFTVENISNSSRTLSVNTTNLRTPFNSPNSGTLEVSANSTRSIAVNFNPSREGSFESTITLTNNRTRESKTLTVIGTSIPQEKNNGVEVTRSTVDFPNTLISEIAETRVTVTNQNNFPVNLNARLSTSSRNPFRITNSVPRQLLPGESTTLNITFTPFNSQNYQETITLETTSEFGNSNKSIRLKGKGLEMLSSNNPELEINSGSNIDFGTGAMSESSYKNVSVKNNSSRSITVSIQRGPGAPFYTDLGAGRYSLEIASGSSRNLRIWFKPEQPGTFSSSFSISTTASTIPNRTFNLTGNALPKGSPSNSFLSILSYATPELITEQTGSAVIAYTTNQSAEVDIKIIKNGRTIKNLKSNQRTSGGQEYKVSWDATNSDKQIVSNGTYQYQITAENSRDEKIEKVGFLKVDISKFNRPNTFSPVTVNRTTINPDLNELTYFSLNLPTNEKFSLEVYNNKSNSLIYSKNYTQNRNQNISWNGRNFEGNKVSAGTYTYVITTNYDKFTGQITVTRNKNHNSQDFNLYFESDPFYSPYNRTSVPTIKNPTLIENLVIAPKAITAHKSSVYLSLINTQGTSLTANVLDDRKQLLKNIVKNMPSNPGILHNHIDWNTQLNGQPAPNGLYFFEITAIKGNERDTEILPFYIDRDPYYETYQQYYQEPQEVVKFYAPYTVNKPVPPVASDCLGFIDVFEDTELCEAITLVVTENLIFLDSERTIRPEDFLTKAESISLISNLIGLTPERYSPSLDGNLGFKDLDTKEWYMPFYKTISKTSLRKSWLKDFTTAYPDGTIRPNQPTTREEVYPAILESIKQSKNIKTNFKLNYDKPKVYFNGTTKKMTPYTELVANLANNTDFAKRYFETYNIKSTNPNFNRKQAVTRQEIFEFIYLLEQTNQIEFNK